MWKEADVAIYQVLYRNVPEETESNGNPFPGLHFNVWPTESETDNPATRSGYLWLSSALPLLFQQVCLFSATVCLILNLRHDANRRPTNATILHNINSARNYPNANVWLTTWTITITKYSSSYTYSRRKTATNKQRTVSNIVTATPGATTKKTTQHISQPILLPAKLV